MKLVRVVLDLERVVLWLLGSKGLFSPARARPLCKGKL